MRNVIIILLILFASTVQASQVDKRLDVLFEQLRASPNRVEAKLVENRIQTIWMENEQEDVNLLMRMGNIAIQLHDFPVAHQIFNLVVQKAPHFAEGWNMRAITYFVMQDFEASLQDTLKTISLEPRHFRAIFRLGNIYLKMGQHEKASVAFRKIPAIHPHFELTKRFHSSSI